MKSLLIDPVARTITEVEYSGDFKGPAGAYELLKCELVELIYDKQFPPDNHILVDEEGLFKRPSYAWRLMGGIYNGLVGRGLTSAVNQETDEGETVESTISIDDLRRRVQWLGEI
jgi:hypothetical protein